VVRSSSSALLPPFEQDFIQDLKSAVLVDLSTCSGCQVGKGWFENYNALQGQISAALESMDTSNGVYITGHSLGAAMAAMAAWDLVRVARAQRSTLHTVVETVVAGADLSRHHGEHRVHVRPATRRYASLVGVVCSAPWRSWRSRAVVCVAVQVTPRSPTRTTTPSTSSASCTMRTSCRTCR
jgi:hypothetical protein